jgi:hypothetical protein
MGWDGVGWTRVAYDTESFMRIARSAERCEEGLHVRSCLGPWAHRAASIAAHEGIPIHIVSDKSFVTTADGRSAPLLAVLFSSSSLFSFSFLIFVFLFFIFIQGNQPPARDRIKDRTLWISVIGHSYLSLFHLLRGMLTLWAFLARSILRLVMLPVI